MAGLVDALYDPEMERLKLQIAQSQAMRQPKQGSRGEMVGRVRTVGNQAGDILGGIVSPFIEQRALDEAKALTEGRQKAEQDWMGRMPSDTYEATLPEGVAGPVGTVSKTPKQLADETRRWGAEGAALPHSPLARAVAAKGMDYAMNAPQRMAEADERTVARTEDRESRLAATRAIEAQRAADKKEADAIRAADKKASDELYRRTAADQNAHLTRTLAMLEGRTAAREAKAGQMTPAQQAKHDANIAKTDRQSNTIADSAAELAGAVRDVSESPGLSRATGIMGMLPSMPGSEAATADTRIETLRGKVTKLGKDIATQSGKIGTMSNAEWQIVSKMVNDLNPNAGEKQLREQLAAIEAAATRLASTVAGESSDPESFKPFEERISNQRALKKTIAGQHQKASNPTNALSAEEASELSALKAKYGR